MPEPIELLAPARTADIGIEAIRHGADAVYIGPPRFGARQDAANSIDDIRRLVAYAHPFGARVYATLNTVLYDDELPDAAHLIRQLHEAGVDALITQDLAVPRLVATLWPNGDGLPLHASTQMDNRTPEQVRFLSEHGFRQVVLARELTLRDIAAIHTACPHTILEVFVHGALCVSLSGRCYASQALCHRSANRGACAQICRLPMDLEDARGRTILRQQHLLSLRDLCHLDTLEALLQAGARSLKIEGRLKDMAYVKNVTAAYSTALNQLIARYPDRWCRASRGDVCLHFTPDVSKSFNRTFTHYFLHGRPTQPIHSPYTPKSLGQRVGNVTRVYTDSFLTDGTVPFANGDGLCYIDPHGQFHGFRVNRVQDNRLYWAPNTPSSATCRLRPGISLYRNYDKAFNDLLQRPSAERAIPIDILLMHHPESIELIASDGVNSVRMLHPYIAPPARTPQTDYIRNQLSRLGGTPYRLNNLTIDSPAGTGPFLPASLLAQWRRQLVGQLLQNAHIAPMPDDTRPTVVSSPDRSSTTYPPLNVANHLARQFHAHLGTQHIPDAYELAPSSDTPIMTCRHCLRYALGACTRRTSTMAHTSPPDSPSAPDPLYLRLPDGQRLTLTFDCNACLMRVFLTETNPR